MGAITNSFVDADRLHHCGIPVWYVYKASSPGHDSALIKTFLTNDEVQSLHNASGIPSRSQQMSVDSYNLMSRLQAPNSVPLWTGSAAHGDRYKVMGAILSLRQSPFEPFTLNSSGTSAVTAPFPPLPETSESTEPEASSSKRQADDEPETLRQPKRGRSSALEVPQASTSAPALPRALAVPSSSRGSRSGGRGRGSGRGRQVGKTTGKGTGNINRSPWDDVVYAPMPAAIVGWQKTLAVMRVKLNATGREGFQDAQGIPRLERAHRWPIAPDAAIFAGITKLETMSASFLAYCKLRDIIRFHADSVTDLFVRYHNIEPQAWRSILGFLILATKHENSQAANRQNAAFEELRKPMAQMGVEVSFDPQLLNTSPASWRGHSSLPSTFTQLPPEDVCREIIWEMNEINFRSDLLNLDQFLFAGFREENAPSPAERRATVLQRFPHFGQSVAPGDNRFADIGFASRDHNEKKAALCSLVEVMEEWKDSYSAPIGLARRASRLKGTQDAAVDEVDSLEVFAVGHYIRAFFGVFKR
ncbi:hypothetical protein CYLTODRAFT_447919, partial [Cylindrobasidium torrendii FP15055 ss-10]